LHSRRYYRIDPPKSLMSGDGFAGNSLAVEEFE
jgi:hypothetical protein